MDNWQVVIDDTRKVLTFSALLLMIGCGSSDLSRTEAFQLLELNSEKLVYDEVKYFQETKVMNYAKAPWQVRELMLGAYFSGNQQAWQEAKIFFKSKAQSDNQHLYYAEPRLDNYRQLFQANLLESWKSKYKNQHYGINDNHWHFVTVYPNKELCKNLVASKGNSKTVTCRYLREKCVLDEVTGISGQGISRKVEYTENCLPTLSGNALGFSERKKTNTANFSLYDDGWRIVQEGL